MLVVWWLGQLDASRSARSSWSLVPPCQVLEANQGHGRLTSLLWWLLQLAEMEGERDNAKGELADIKKALQACQERVSAFPRLVTLIIASSTDDIPCTGVVLLRRGECRSRVMCRAGIHHICQ
jgi:hypothetical protein